MIRGAGATTSNTTVNTTDHTTRDSQQTPRRQIEFSLSLLRISQPGSPPDSRAGELTAARIAAIEGLLALAEALPPR
jgi:hypothetical protein